MNSVKERISRHSLMDDRLGAIALVEDEIDNLIERIYKTKAILRLSV